MDPLDLAPPFVLPPASSSAARTGNKKSRNVLPKVFLLATDMGKERRILGCIQVCNLVHVEPADSIYAVLAGTCPLLHDVIPKASDFRFKNVCSSLKSSVESEIRSSAARCGGTLNSNFHAFVSQSWRVWHVDETTSRALMSDKPPSFFPASKKHALAIGVDLEVVQSLSEVVHDLDQAYEARPEVAASSVQGTSAEDDDAPISSSSVAPPLADAQKALSRLSDLATPREKGVVTHSYRPEVILNSLCLKAALLPSVQLADALKLTAPFFFGHDGSSAFTSQSLAEIDLPSDNVLRDGRIKIDSLAVLWERKSFDMYMYWRYLSPDASPQLGWQWLVLREDRFAFPKEKFESETSAAIAANFDEALQSRTCHLSVYGRGRGSLVNKSVCVNNIHKMESEDEVMHAELVAQVFGITSDQGTEKGQADIDTMEEGSVAHVHQSAGAGHLYPFALWMPEALHILYNALESSIKKLRGHEHWLNRLKSIERFLCDKSMRRLFRLLFGQDDPEFLKSYSTVHIDWRWEMLSKALDQLLPILRKLRERFDLDRFLRSEDGAKVDANVVREAHVAINSTHFPELSEMMRLHGKILEKYAHRLEGCECHRSLLTSKTYRANKRKRMQQMTGYPTCFMKNRQACWFAAVGYDQLLAEVGACSSDAVQEALQAMDPTERPSLIRLMTLLSEAIKEELAHKYGFLQELPYCIIKIFWGEIHGGCTDRAREWAKEAVDKYDAVILAGNGERLHRVAHLVLAPGECREQLVMFSSHSTSPLSAFPAAYSVIKRYALIPMCGRRVEAVHSEIKRIGLVARNASPPLISAKLSEPKNLSLLQTNPAFRSFCQSKWNSRRLFDDVLKLVVPSRQLGGLSRGEKINRIYQCSLADEFRDVEVEKRARAEWLAQTLFRRRVPRTLPLSWSLGVSYLRAKLASGVVFSLPSALLDLAEIAPQDADFDYQAVNPWEMAIGVGSEGASGFNWRHVETTSFFEVINPNPHRRQNVVLHHLDRDDNIVHIVRRRRLSHQRRSGQVNLLSTTANHKALYLRTMVNMLPQYLPHLFAWRTIAHGEAQGIRWQGQAQTPITIQPMILPSLASAASSSAIEAVPVLADSIVQRVPDEVANAVLAKLGGGESPPNVAQQWIPFMALEGVAWDTIAAMADEGALCVKENSAGEVEIARREEGIKYLNAQTVGEAIQAMRVDFSVCSSKLDSVLALLRQEWRPNADAVPFVSGGPKHFLCIQTRPASYFTCLVVSEHLFAKGIVDIPHNARDLVYQAMLRLTGEALVLFLERVQRGALEDAWLKEQLKRSETAAITDSGDPPVNAPSSTDDVAPFVPPLLPVLVDLPAVQWARAKVVTSHGVEHKVIMDHCSAASGGQRAYINCKVPHHENCFLWRTCNLHADRDDLCGYLMAWALSGHVYASRAGHMESPPPTDQRVAEIKAEMTVTNF